MNNQIKTLAIIIAVLLSFNANAQIKVYSGGNTYIGGTGTTPLSILSVGGAGASSYTGYFYNPSTTVTSASGIRAENAAPTTGGIGVYSVSGIITPGTYSTCAGVIGAAYRSSAATGAYAYGVYGYAGNAYNGVNYGVYGLLLGSNNGAGVYASVYGPSIVGGKYAGYFDGIIYHCCPTKIII